MASTISSSRASNSRKSYKIDRQTDVDAKVLRLLRCKRLTFNVTTAIAEYIYISIHKRIHIHMHVYLLRDDSIAEDGFVIQPEVSLTQSPFE